MKISRIKRQDTGFFSQQQSDFCYHPSQYSPFITEPFSVEAFLRQIQRKKATFSLAQRELLVQQLLQQLFPKEEGSRGYVAPEYANLLRHNIESLAQENTFTVVTGHQLVAMTGPLYLIYKIAHVIHLSELLKKQYPQHHFVPVFWMATEDHDFEEIQSFHLFNRTFSWNSQQSGPVGRFSMENWETIRTELSHLFANHPQSEIFDLLRTVDGENYAQAYTHLIGRLFGRYGLVIINADDAVFKRQFIPYMEQEINEHFSYKTITKTTQKLVAMGGKEQIVPRQINLFYIQNGIRERLIEQGDKIEIPTQGVFSKDEILTWIRSRPEEFSPNVSLRPLYQEVLLPNLCYVGGAGEINYWLQLKEMFDHVHIPFPLLQTRNSLLWVDQNTAEKLTKINLTPTDMFKELHVLQREYMESVAGDEIQFEAIDRQLKQLQDEIRKATIQIDSALESYAMAEGVRLEKQVQHLKEKLYKTVKSKHDKHLKTIQQIKEKLFPNGQLQERYTNFFQLAPDGNYSEVLQQIVACIDPLSNDMLIVEQVEHAVVV